ncbi:MAG: hypothetical protein IJT62_04090 [Oscillospiraceae bacterium]|nr:hypothetical protein [Oscillospiraceae bacterium]
MSDARTGTTIWTCIMAGIECWYLTRKDETRYVLRYAFANREYGSVLFEGLALLVALLLINGLVVSIIIFRVNFFDYHFADANEIKKEMNASTKTGMYITVALWVLYMLIALF